MRRRAAVLLALALAVVLAVAVVARWRAGTRPTGATTVVLVTIDTMRRDRCGAYGARPSPTPRIDAFAAEALVVEDARSPVPLTLPSHTTMLTGLPPARTGVRSNASGRIAGPAGRPFPLLAERARVAGYRTGAFVSAAPLAARYGLDQGFERYDDEDLDDRTGLSYKERAGTETVDRALAWLRGLGPDARALLFVHLFEPHAPYVVYEQDVAAADAAFGRLLDGLAAEGRGDAVLLLTSDHGEALLDLGEPTHGLLLGDAVLRVPMILRAPGRTGRLLGPADVADVAPTLARAAGLEWPASDGRPGSGEDLLGGSSAPGRVRVAESFYAHQRFRWAQLAAAVSPRGETLVDVGAGRAYLMPPTPFGEPQATPTPVRAASAEIRTLTDALAEYKRSERRELITAGAAPGGYAQTGRAAPFLSGEENARLPDPYERIPAAVALDQWKAKLHSGVVPPPQVAAGLRGMLDKDDGNAELWFWYGRALEDHDRAGAEKAFQAAWERGRREPSTLLLLAGVNAPGHEAEHLEILHSRGKEIPEWDCALHVLDARLLRAAGRHEEACEALRRAEAACRTPKERETLKRLRAELGCP